MNTKKSNLLNWRNKRTTETADPKAKVVLSDDTFVDFSEITTDVELEEVEEKVEQLSEVVTEQGGQLDDVEDAVSVIESKIPTEASSQNQLADKDFVNESVATASAAFKGTYNSLQELEQVEANANDYGFVIVEDLYGNTRYDRYKYTEGEGWLFEYSINSVQFSSSQWNAINSGIDDSKVNKLNDLPTKSQLDASLDTKANKSEMAVSTNADKTTITLKTGTSAEVINAHQDISGKVDKETGKGLSTNDYTDAEKTKLGDLPTNSELTATLNTKVDKVQGKGLSTEDYTTAEKTKLSEIATGAEVNVQSDWNETDGSSDAYIQNKPTNVSTFTNDAGYLTQHQDISGKANKSEMSVSTNADKTTITLKTGTSAEVINAHQDISGKVDVSDFEETEYAVANALVNLDGRINGLATVASTGDYDDLDNKPTIPTVPTNVSAFTNDAGYLTQHQSLANYVQFNDLSSVATSGDYDDLSNKPTLFSGDYNDLTNKPTIPTVPTNVSAFTNDAGYLTQHQDISGKVDVADFLEAEEVTAEALVDLDARVVALEQAIETLTNNA